MNTLSEHASNCSGWLALACSTRVRAPWPVAIVGAQMQSLQQPNPHASLAAVSCRPSGSVMADSAVDERDFDLRGPSGFAGCTNPRRNPTRQPLDCWEFWLRTVPTPKPDPGRLLCGEPATPKTLPHVSVYKLPRQSPLTFPIANNLLLIWGAQSASWQGIRQHVHAAIEFAPYVWLHHIRSSLWMLTSVPTTLPELMLRTKPEGELR